MLCVSDRTARTGAGPFAPDVFWILRGSAGGCAVPHGATGDRELLERLQAGAGLRQQCPHRGDVVDIRPTVSMLAETGVIE
jgi:hypothetical protein